jgi:hypothetical protein
MTKVTVIINGVTREVDTRRLCTWSTLCSLARHGRKGMDHGKTVTYKGRSVSGELAPLDPPIEWENGMIFNVMRTGNA